jgi:hypothetical protein
MKCSLRMVLLTAVVMSTATGSYAQRASTRGATTGIAPGQTVPGTPSRPNIPGSPGSPLGAGAGMPTRPNIPGTPGTPLGAAGTMTDPDQRGCGNGAAGGLATGC